jgi:hypothetical protein
MDPGSLIQKQTVNLKTKKTKKSDMKKLIITSACAFAVAGMALGQGTVNWSVLSPAAITFQTNSTVASSFGGTGPLHGSTAGFTGTGVGGSGFYFALLYTSYTGSQLTDPTSISQLDSQGWAATGLTATNSATSAGKLGATSPSTQATVPWNNGTTNNVMLVGWSANLGSSWGAVSNVLANWSTDYSTISGLAFFGVSATGYINPGTANPGVQVFATSGSGQGLPIDSLNTPLYELTAPVPEPGTIALAVLGGASMLLFRRKK